MDKERFLDLHKQYSLDTVFLSSIEPDHPAYVELFNAGPDIIPWLLERLQNTIGHDEGDTFDSANCIHLSTCLIGQLTHGRCWEGYPEELAGVVSQGREHILNWGRREGLLVAAQEVPSQSSASSS
jgi:hypothetical protein